MTNIHIRVRGALKKPFGKSDIQYSCKPGMTVTELLKDLGYKEEYLPIIMVSVNNELKSHKYIIQENDEVMLFVNVGGG